MKRTISLFLSLILILSVFQVAFPVFAIEYSFNSVVLSESEITLNTDSGGKKKQTLTLAYVDENLSEVEITEDTAILWKSSSNSVATVSNGTVTAVSNGECIITATVFVDFVDTGISAQCKVTVRDSINTHYADLQSAVDAIPEDYETSGVYLETTVETLKNTVAAIDWDLEDTEENCSRIDEWKQAILSATEGLREHTTAIKITDYPEEVAVGDEDFVISFDVTGYDEVVWESSDENVAAIDNSGKVTILGGCSDADNNYVTFTVSSYGFTDSCTIKINNPINKIELDKAEYNIYTGENSEIIATGFGKDENAPITHDYAFTWTSSDEEVATVENGIVTALKSGETEITVKYSDEIYAVCALKVTDPTLITDVVIKDQPAKVTAGFKAIASLTISPADATYKAIEWTSDDDDIVKVESAGAEGNIAYAEITGVSAGKATITYKTTDGTDISGSFEIEVIPYSGIKFEEAKLTLNTDDYGKKQAQLTLIYLNDDGEEVEFTGESHITWETEKSSVATVDENGVVTAVSNGSCDIYATDALTGKTATCRVVVRYSINKFYADFEAVRATIPEDYKDESRYLSSAAQAVDTILGRYSNQLEDTAENCTAISSLTASLQNAIDQLKEAEIAAPTDEAFWREWNEAYALMPENKDAYFEDGIARLEEIAETVYGEDGNKIWLKRDKAAINKLAEEFIEAFGQLRPRTSDIEIVGAPESVLFTEGSFTLSYVADGYDEVGWTSSDEEVATIDNEGNVTIHCASRNAEDPTVTFTVTANGVSASCKVGILNPIASAKMKESTAVVYSGVPLDLKLNMELTGVDENAPVTAPFETKWTTSDSRVATVEDGVVTAVGLAGTSTIYFLIDGVGQDFCNVTVKQVVNAAHLNIYEKPEKVTAGESVQAKIEVLPTQVSFPELEWSSSNEDIATVKSAGTDGNIAIGEITGVGQGLAVITFKTTDGTNISGTLLIEVLPARDVSIMPDSITLNIDGYGVKTATLTAMFTDAKGTYEADPSLIKWSSSKISVATVENGKVTALANGTCYIYATDTVTGKVAQCEVTVRDTITTYYNRLETAISYIPADYEDAAKYDETAIANLKAAIEEIDWELTDSKENCDKVDMWKNNIDRYRLGLIDAEYAPRDDEEFWGPWNEAEAVYYELPPLSNYTDESAELIYSILEEVNGEDGDKKWFKSQKDELHALAQQMLDAIANLKEKTSAIEITDYPQKWNVGDEPFSIYYNIEGYDEVVWKSSDESVLVIENAVDAYGKAYGKATVVGGCEDAENPYVTVTVTSGEYSDSRQIKIINPVTSIELSKSLLVLFSNETYRFEIIKKGADPEKPAIEDVPIIPSWSSSKPSVATVDSTGLVTPVAPGTGCDVTVSYGNLTASCRVTVSRVEPIEKLTPISIASRVTVNSTTTASVFITPVRASIKDIEWTSADEDIAVVVSNGTDDASYASAAIRGVSEGKTTITYKTKDGTNISGSFTITVDPLVSSLTLDKTSMMVYIGDTQTEYKLTPKILPANAGNQVLNWISSDENVAKVVNGKIEVLSVGKTVISAYTTDGTTCSASCELTVLGDASSMTINKTTSALKVGQTLQLSSTVTTKQGITYNAPIWTSSDTSKATVDANGKVTPKLPGTVTITAKSYDGMTRTCTLTITADLYGISLPGSMTLAVGRSKAMTPTYDPSYATNKTVKWKTTNPSVATVDSSGTVTAVAVGTAIITATSEEGGYVAVCTVTVVRPVTSVSISKSSYSLTMGSKTTVTLTATVNPSNATNKKVTWKSSNTKVATVENGKVKAVGPGTANITVTTVDGGYSRTCKITVIQPVTGVKFSTSSRTMYVGQKSTFTYTVMPTNATDKGVSFKSSNKKIATVDSKGKVTAKKTGTCKIYITTDDGSYKATRTVKVVKKVDVKSVKLNYSSKTLDKGKTLTLKPTISPKNASNQKVTWKSSDTKIATVNSNGVVTAKKGGTVTITCTTKDKKKVATCKIKVYEGVSSISLSASSITLATGKSMTLTAKVSPSSATNTSVKWSSSNKNIATVTSKGKVKAVKAGTAYITAKSKDNSKVLAKCKVTIVQSPTKIKLSKSEVDIRTGGKITLTPTVTPSNSYDKSVTWYSNKPSVARVSDSGVVTGMKAGTATITCTSNANPKIKKSCVVTVSEPVLGVTLSSKSLTMTTGRTKTLVANINPATATNKSVTWKSSDKSVVEVNKKGKVEAVGPGQATITCTTKDGLYVAKCKITVIQSVISVRLNKTSTTIGIGDTKKLTATIKPKDATNQEVIWRSSNSKIARVTQSGRVTALKEGTVKITCTTEDGGLVAVCTVKCVIPVEGVSLNKTSVTIKKGKTFKLKADIYPSDATIKDVTWSSSNKKIATIDKNGKITAKKKGTVTITCKTKNGGYKITCKVKVK